MKIKKIASFLLCTITAAAMMFSGCGSVNPNAVLLNVNKGEMTVSAGLGNFICRMNQAYYDQSYLYYYGPTMWVDNDYSFTNEAKDSMLDNIKQMAACSIHASEYGASITPEDEAAIKSAVSEFMLANSEETLQKMGATTEYVTEYMRMATLYNKVAKAMSDAADVSVSEDEVWQRQVKYAYFDTTVAADDEGNQIPVTEEMIAVQKEEAAKLAKSFDAELEKVSAVSGEINYTKGDQTGEIFPAELVNVIDNLAEGEVSEPVEIDGVGIFVIKILADKDSDATTQKMSTLETQRREDAADEKLNALVESMTFDLNKGQWDKIQFTELFNVLQSEAEESVESIAQ